GASPLRVRSSSPGSRPARAAGEPASTVTMRGRVTLRVYGRRAGARPDAHRVSLVVMQVDRVLLARPRGFCAGVEMAIKALAWMVRVFEPPVYCYHEIVHNRLVVDRFRNLGVVFVDSIDDVPDGAPVMLSAHGSAPDVVAAA